MGGKDSASARYINTHLELIVNYIFRKEDTPLLKYLDDDGIKIEPEYYLPIIPLILVNGSIGVGTGFSTNIIPYNPIDLVEKIK